MKGRGVVENAMTQQRPILHQSAHGVSPWRFVFGSCREVTGPPSCREVRTASPRAGKPRQPEPANIDGGASGLRQIGQRLADHRRELEAVAGAGRGDHDALASGQAIDDEIAVGRHGVEAGLGVGHRARGRRQHLKQRRGDRSLVGRADDAVAGVGIDHFTGMMVLGDLQQAVVLQRKAVMDAVLALDHEDRKPAGPE